MKEFFKFFVVCLSFFLSFKVFSHISAFFNSPKFNDNLSQVIIGFIDQSIDNISISAYSFDDPNILNSLINAANRGVKIRITIDSDYWSSMIDYLDSHSNIEVVNDLKTKGYVKNSRQHHSKFLVIDYNVINSPVRNTVITGSFNFTLSSSVLQYNNLVIVSNNVDIANIYIQEFNEEWGSADFSFNPSLSRFGKQKKDPPPYIHQSGNIEVYFSYSPVNKIANRLYELIESSSNVFICMYSFSTNSYLFDLIYRVCENKDVYGVFDGSQAFRPFSAFTYLRDKKPDNFVVDSEYKILHNKYIVLNYDENYPENAIVITGSYNLSKNAEENNEENVIIIKGVPDISKKYISDFLYHFSKSGKKVPIFSIPSFEKTNIVCLTLSTNVLLGSNLHRVMAIFISNDEVYTSVNVLSNSGNEIFFTAPDVVGVFNLISLFDNGDREIIPVELVIFRPLEPFLLVNKGQKFLVFGDPVEIRLYSQDNSYLNYVKVILGNEEKLIFLNKEGDYFKNLVFLDTFSTKITNHTPIVFNYSNTFLTNYVVLPQFSYYIDKPKKIYKNSYSTFKVNIVGKGDRKFKLSANGNVPLDVKEDGSVSFFTGNFDMINVFLTIEDDIGNSFSEYIEFEVFDNNDIVIYPTIVGKEEKIFIDGKFEKIEIFDKSYNKLSFYQGEDEIGRKYIVPKIFRNSELLFVVIYVDGKKFVKKVIVK